MPLDVEKFIEKKNKRNFLHKIKYVALKTWRKTRRIIKKILLIMWELFYYWLLGVIASINLYDSYSETKTPQGIFTFLYIGVIVYHKIIKGAYKSWEESAKHDEFNARFIRYYKLPLLLPQLIGLYFLAKFCSPGSFFICLLMFALFEISERRYITNNIKQDMILEKLDTINKIN